MTAQTTPETPTADPAAGLSPAERVQRLIDLTERLSAVIETENELLSTRRPREIGPCQPEKSRLAAAYAEEIRAVAADRNRYRGAGESLISKLKEITGDFEEKASHQRALIEGVKRVSEGVVKAVAEEVRAAQPRAAGYGQKGPTPAQNPASIAIDQKF